MEQSDLSQCRRLSLHLPKEKHPSGCTRSVVLLSTMILCKRAVPSTASLLLWPQKTSGSVFGTKTFLVQNGKKGREEASRPDPSIYFYEKDVSLPICGSSMFSVKF